MANLQNKIRKVMWDNVRLIHWFQPIQHSMSFELFSKVIPSEAHTIKNVQGRIYRLIKVQLKKDF